jgi:hypothetical protein
MTNPNPPLLPASTEPHPIDVALAALSQFTMDLLASGRVSRFAELQRVGNVAMQVQQLRPVAGVDDVQPFDDGQNIMAGQPIMMRRHAAMGFNDGADLNREVIMLAQKFFEEYTKTLSKKETKSDSRMSEVMELSDLVGLRSRLRENKEEIPDAINTRIDHLVQRIGEPPHEPEPDTVVFANDVRRRPPDGAGEPYGGRVGEPLAERAGGDDGPG